MERGEQEIECRLDFPVPALVAALRGFIALSGPYEDGVEPPSGGTLLFLLSNPGVCQKTF